MPTFRTLTLALVAAAVAATAVARWHSRAADVHAPTLQVHAERHHQTRADTAPDPVYLPDRFVDEERVAPVEPLPPQF